MFLRIFLEIILLRSISSSSLYKNSISSSCNFKSSEYQGGSLPRRLVSSESEQTTFNSRLGKMSQVPSQKITYLGGIFHLDLGIVTPTLERIEKLNLALEKLCSGHNQARDFLHLLGIMVSCIDLIPNARLYMRPIQLHLLSFWKPVSQKLDGNIPFTQHLKSHLIWWKNGANTLKGRHFQQPKTNITIMTDALKLGYRGFMGNQVFQGTWSSNQSKLHINWLKLKAVYLTVNHFLSQIKNQAVLIRSDNIDTIT